MKFLSFIPPRKSFRIVVDKIFRKQNFEIYKDILITNREVKTWGQQLIKEDKNAPNFAILSFTDLPIHAKFHCLVAKSMQVRGYHPIIFSYSGNHFAHSYYRLFGLTDLLIWNKYSKELNLSNIDLEKEVYTLLPKTLTVVNAKSIVFHDVHIGEHALSMTCRKRVEGRLNLQDKNTFELFHDQLLNAMRSVLVAESYLDNYPIDKMLVRDAGYIPSGPIFEVALNRGVDCIVLEIGQRRSTWIFKRYTKQTRGQHYFSLSPVTWERIKHEPWTKEIDDEVENEFAGRYRPDSSDDTRRLQSGKQIFSPDEVCKRLGLNPKFKTAVIFSHVAWDAAFFFGTGLFDDFEDWLFQTVKFVASTPECQKMNWIVKEHPFNVFKLQREKIKISSEQRLLKPLMPFPNHIKFMSANTEINTKALFPLVNCVLTVNGTVGMEFPCYGIPAVISGTGRYNGYGFTIEPKTKAEYFEALRNLYSILPLTGDIKQLARKHYYELVIGKQISFEDIAPMEIKRIHEAQSDIHDNIHFTVKDLEEFHQARSINLLVDWLASSNEPDLLDDKSIKRK